VKRRIIGLASALGLASIAVQSCADATSLGRGFDDDAGLTPIPSLTSPDAGDASSFEDGGPLLACIATDCPAPWATCSSEGKPAYKCESDLQHDSNHCGACGNKCLTYEPIHMTSRCVDGACQPECYTKPERSGDEDWRNCDALLDNGCEVDVLVDPNHCGACGNECPAGTPCILGQCGCPSGFILCAGVCVDPMTSDLHCGACDNVCTPPSDACSTPQPNTGYGCKAGQCMKKCINNAADCNGDMEQSTCDGDGCEVVGLDTNENCGGCGIRCTKPSEECIDEGNGYVCAVPCAKVGQTMCRGECVDLLNDVSSCGACGDKCDAPGPNQVSSCSKGVCVYACAPGFGDCNGNAADGCETNLRQHPGNCGACGNACDLAAGQPCIEGACLMKECEEVPN